LVVVRIHSPSGVVGRRPLPDQVEELRDVLRLMHWHVVCAVAGEDEVCVGVVEAREHRAARLVDHRGPSGDQVVESVRLGRDGDDPVAPDGERALRGLARHEGVDGLRADHKVRAWARVGGVTARLVGHRHLHSPTGTGGAVPGRPLDVSCGRYRAHISIVKKAL
jgi:hypothetical protein